MTVLFLGTFAKLRKANISFVMSARLYVHVEPTTERIFMKFDI